MTERGGLGRQRASEMIRKQKRKELDARRSKCRIRLGGHLEQWCQLKEQLGFSLHSQLAKYLLDRYSSPSSTLKTGQDGSALLPDPLPSDTLQHLVVLSHNHSQECAFIPNVKSSFQKEQKGVPRGHLVWECLAGHTFTWSPSTTQTCASTSYKVTASQCHEEGEEEEEKEEEEKEKEKAVSSKPSPPPSPAVRRRRSLRRAAAAHAFSLALASNSPCPVDEAEPSSKEDGEGGAERERTACMSASRGTGLGEEADLLSGHHPEETAASSEEIPAPAEFREPESTLTSSEGRLNSLPDQPEEERREEEDLEEEDGLEYIDNLSDENYHPSLDRDSKLQRHQNLTRSCKGPAKEDQLSNETCLTGHLSSEDKGSGICWTKWVPPPRDEDVAQIGRKRIRKAAKREILLCDYDGCGKIFSNRQYLNHHKKYQHVHQKTFTCSDPSCGKSFNFKKHLKEHEKLHSDKRDYICEFCARSFRTSSNLIIHRRIHTGEKPLQCEICGFTCRQKASLNWHMKKHDADSFYQFSCDLCGKKFEKKDNVTAHKSKSHPEAAAAAAAGPPQPTQRLPPTSHPLSEEPLEDTLGSQPHAMEKRMDQSPLAITVIIE